MHKVIGLKPPLPVCDNVGAGLSMPNDLHLPSSMHFCFGLYSGQLGCIIYTNCVSVNDYVYC